VLRSLHFEGGKGVKLSLKADKTKEEGSTSAPTNRVVGDRVHQRKDKCPANWVVGDRAHQRDERKRN
jgi:hypothetical protein